MTKSKRTKALAIPKKVKDEVFARDRWCICCGSPYGLPEAHVVPRSQGGLGIAENVVTLCRDCHRAFDQSADREDMRTFIIEYLRRYYPKWNENDMKYRR